jgi:hypothetical protein
VVAQHRKRGLEVVQCLGLPVELVEDGASLRPRPRPPHSGTQARQCRFDLLERLPSAPPHGQREGERHPGLAHQLGRGRLAVELDRRAQVPERGVWVFELQGRDSQGPLGHRMRFKVVLLACLRGNRTRKSGRFDGI